MKRKVEKRLKKRSELETGAIPPLELLEESVHVLRSNISETLPFYAFGSVPLVLAMIYFVSDMSQRSDALDVLPGAATTMTLLFIWKNAWQSIFLRKVMDILTLRDPEKVSMGEFARIAFQQGIVQSFGLFVQILSAIILLPIAWTTAFFASFAVYSGEPRAMFSQAFTSAARHSRVHTAQNHVILLCLSVAAFLVWMNISVLLFFAPWMLKTFLGVETFFSKANSLEIIVNMIFNTTFWSVVVGLTYLAVDPILKTAYAVRVFHADSAHKGYDIIADLKRLGAMSAKTALACFLAVVLSFAAAAPSEAAPVQTADKKSQCKERLDPKKLDSAMKKVLSKREYTWRLPPEANRASEESAFIAFLKGIWKTLDDGVSFFDKLMRKLFNNPPRRDSNGSAFMSLMAWLGANALQLSLILLVALLLITLLIIRKRRKSAVLAAAESSSDDAAKETPDLNDESLTADSLEHNEWLEMASEMLRKGNLKLAMRAFFLATIAALARNDYLMIAKYKTNRDYSREVGRRLHAKPEVVAAFKENVGTFERVWYGEHEVDADRVEHFKTNQEKIGNSVASE